MELGVSDQLIGKLEQGRGGSLESFEDAARALGMKLGFVDAAYVAPTPKKVHPADYRARPSTWSSMVRRSGSLVILPAVW